MSKPRNREVGNLLRIVFGVSLPVGRAAYAIAGFSLVIVKYGVEVLTIWIYTAAFFPPWQFVNPLLSGRADLMRNAPEWLPWLWFIWTLPFLWIAITMSVRRAADVGASPWLGMIVLIPGVNLMFMLVMCLIPGRSGDHWAPHERLPGSTDAARQAVLGVSISLIIGAGMLVVSVYLLSTYGASLFLGTPLIMGSVAAYVYNRSGTRTHLSSVSIGLVSVVGGASALLLFALEGLICIVMATPLMLPLGALGGVLGKAIADSTRRPHRDLLTVLVVLPLLAGVEAVLSPAPEYRVTTAIEIDAPPEVVWENVIRFPDLPEPAAWYFRMGIACPQRARIVGEGVGATRYCEFTTGAFVEPITCWDEPRRLAFDVAEGPAPMFELSPYRDIHPPHLDGFLQSNRGEFLLIPLPGGRTRLEGSTWYEFRMSPAWYWTLWSDLFVHRIHQRVLLHIKGLSEAPRL